MAESAGAGPGGGASGSASAGPSAGHAQLRSLQVLRAVAALLVVMFHAETIIGRRIGGDAVGGLFSEGSRGVDLFFVLSGFVITYAHLRDWGRPPRLGNYLYNRLCRIYPSVWIMCALAVAMYLLGRYAGLAIGMNGGNASGKLAAWNIIAGALLLPQKGYALVNVTWTLKHEMVFYLIFALLIVERRFLALLVLWQAAVLGCVLAGIRFEGGWVIYLLGPIKLEFGLGMLCALLVMYRARIPALTRPALPAAGLLLGVAIFVGGAMLDTYQHALFRVPELLVYGGASALIVVGAALLELSGPAVMAPAGAPAGAPVWAPVWAPAVLLYLGEASYAIYLVHFAVIMQLSGLLVAMRVPIGVGLYLAIAACGVLAGVAFHQYIDQPIQRALRRAKPYLLGPERRLVGRRAAAGGWAGEPVVDRSR